MANSEALEELHSRLATRLQAARTEDVAAAWLAVQAGGVNYLLPLTQAGEIFPLTPVLAVPYAKPWFLGVANLRGGLFGVVDLAGYLSGTNSVRAVAGLSEQARADARMVSLNAALETNSVLLVDRLAGLRHASVFNHSAPPAAGAAPGLGPLYTDANGEVWQALDLLALARQPEFLSISA